MRRAAALAGTVAGAGLLAAGAMALHLARIARGDPAQARGPEKPNVVLVTLDTCRRDHLSVYGYARPTSPTLEALAKDSVLFDAAFTVATNSAPSHATILTGLYPFEHGLVDNGLRLAPGVPTLATVLHDAGYRTAAFVGYEALGRESGLDRGFDVFELDEVDECAHDERGIETDSRGVAAALAWLGKQGDAPFFLWVHVQEMHGIDPPPPYDAMFLPAPGREDVKGFAGGAFDLRCYDDVIPAFVAGNLSPALQEKVLALYDGEVRFADDSVGRLIAALRQAGKYDDTLVVVTADHGQSFFEDHDFGPGHTEFYSDAVLRVPLVVKPARGSGAVPGVRVGRMVSTIDVLPTILDLLRFERPPWLAGRSRIPGVIDAEAPGQERIFFEEAPFGIRYCGVRTRAWKLVLRADQDGETASVFDLARDSGEARNVADDERGQAAALEQQLASWRAGRKVAASSSYADMSPEMKKALERAGYLRKRPQARPTAP